MLTWFEWALTILFGLVLSTGIFELFDRKQEFDAIKRQERYEACLERTIPAVCELHLVIAAA